MKALLLASLLLLAAARDYPLYSQCDPKWSKERLGTSSHTICEAGDLVSALAMGMTGVGHTQTPSTLNNWLKSNKGYDSKTMVVWKTLNAFGMTFEGTVPNSLLRINLDVGYLVIINVNKGAHWVLATGYSGSTIFVKDSLHTTTTSYDISQVVSGHNAVYKVPVSVPASVLTSLEENRLIYNLFKHS